MSDLFLTSTELRESYAPRTVKIVRRLATETRDDLALVHITPPLPKDVYGTEDDLTELILATRLQGDTLFPLSNLPVAVYVCRFVAPVDSDTEAIDSEKLSILDWGELHPDLP